MEILGLLVPFTGEFIETGGGSNTVQFYIESETGYGISRYNNSPANESYYCLVDEPNSVTDKIYEMHGGGCEARNISWVVDTNDNIKTLTINGITYEPST